MKFNKKILIVSIASCVAMLLVQMLYEGLSPVGTGFWAPLVYTATSVMPNITIYISFDSISVIVGLLIYLFISIIFGVVYEIMIEMFQNKNMKILARILFVLVSGLIMWFLILPVINPMVLYMDRNIFFISILVWILVFDITAKMIEN